MFDKIYFYSYNGSYKRDHESYGYGFAKLRKDYPALSQNDDEAFQIDGQAYFLYPHPMPERLKRQIIYLVSFVYMLSNRRYYTRRANYHAYLIVFTYGGCGRLIYDDQEYLLREGDGFIIDCIKEHYFETAEDTWNHSDLTIQGTYVDLFYQEFLKQHVPVFHCANQDGYQKLLERILETHEGNSPRRDFLCSTLIEQLLELIADTLTKQPAKNVDAPAAIQQLRGYLEKNFMKTISLNEMARLSGISKYHLSREFKRITGFSPNEYVIRLRILRAAFLLKDTDIPSYRVGELVGFENESNYIRNFKAIYHMTPGEYRKCNSVLW